MSKQDWKKDKRPFYLVVSAPDHGSPLVPDDLVIEPAWDRDQVEMVWDGVRSMGGYVVAVYSLDRESGHYARDRSFGMMGDWGRLGPADPDREEDRLS